MASSVLPEPVVLRLQGRRIAPLLQPLLDALSWPAVLLPHRSWLLNSPFQLELRGNLQDGGLALSRQPLVTPLAC